MPPADLDSRLRDLTTTGLAAYNEGRFAEAVVAFRASVALSDESARPAESLTLSNLAGALLGVGRIDESEAHYLRALEAAERSGDRRAEATAGAGLGHVLQRHGRYDEAVERFATAAHQLEAAGFPEESAVTRVDLGGAAYLAGHYESAARAWETALDGMRGWASPEQLVPVLANLGGVWQHLRLYDRALDALDEATEQIPSPLAATRLGLGLAGNRGLALLALGRLDEGLASLEAARRGAVAIAAHQERAAYAAILSDAHRIRGHLPDAIQRHREALDLQREHGFSLKMDSSVAVVALQDRSIWVEVGHEEPDLPSDHRRRNAERNLTDTIADTHGAGTEAGQRPFLIIAPACAGLFGPVFPRGATALASFLNDRGIPSVVVPLSHYIDPRDDTRSGHDRMREVVADAITSLSPRAVGISVTFSHLYPDGLAIARAVAALDPDLPVIIGGPHVTYWDIECLEEAPEVDVVVRGEGEWTAFELLKALQSGDDLAPIRGITWRAPDGSIRRNRLRPLGDVLELPEVDFDLLPSKFARGMEVFGLSSRGCTFRCRYCHEFRYWGGVVRQYPVERIVNELERLYRDHGNPMRGIDDSMLNMLEPYFLELMHALGGSPHLPERFGLLTRVDTISDEGLQAMKDVGIRSLSVGMESGSDKVLEVMNKGITIEQALVGLEKVRAAEAIHLSTFFIVGHPGDNPVEAERSTAFVDRLFGEGLTTFADVSMFTPLPGTPYFSRPEKHGVRILTLDWTRWVRSNRPIAELADFSSDEIYLAYLCTLEVQARHGRVLPGFPN